MVIHEVHMYQPMDEPNAWSNAVEQGALTRLLLDANLPGPIDLSAELLNPVLGVCYSGMNACEQLHNLRLPPHVVKLEIRLALMRMSSRRLFH